MVKYVKEALLGAVPDSMMLVRMYVQVYSSLEPKAFFLELSNNGEGLKGAWDAFLRMEDAITLLDWYYALNGISILLLIAR